MRFKGQDPSRGHKFSILENFLSIRDFTSQTLASFPSDLVGVASHRQVRTMSRVWGGTVFAKRSGAMKAPVGLLSGQTGGTMTKTNVQSTPSNSQHHDTPNNKARIE